MYIRKIQTLFCTIVLLTACTSNRRQPVIQESPKHGQNKQDESKTPADNKEQILPSDGSANSTTLPIVLDEAAIRNAYADIDTSNMTYRFEYLTNKSLGSVNFQNGTAQLEFKDLPVGQKGDLSFTLLEAGIARLRGEQKDMVLAKGKNQISLVLKSVASQDSSTAELTINIEVNPSDINSSQPDSGGGGIIKPDPGPSPSPGSGGNTPSDPNALTFSKSIKPMMTKHCAECHHQGGQVPDLTSKSAFESQFDKILARIEGAGQPMPPLPRDRMSAQELETLRSWKSKGFQP